MALSMSCLELPSIPSKPSLSTATVKKSQVPSSSPKMSFRERCDMFEKNAREARQRQESLQSPKRKHFKETHSKKKNEEFASPNPSTPAKKPERTSWKLSPTVSPRQSPTSLHFIHSSAFGSVADRKRALTHDLTDGAARRYRTQLKKLANQKSLARLSSTGTGRSEEENELSRKIFSDRVKKQKKGMIPTVEVHEDVPGEGPRVRAIDITDIFVSDPSRAVELVEKMGWLMPDKDFTCNLTRKSSNPCSQILMMNNDDRLLKLSRTKRSQMEDLVAEALRNVSTLTLVSMSNCGVNDTFLIKILDALESRTDVQELHFGNRGNEINCRGALRLAEFLSKNRSVISIKISGARGTISHGMIDRLIEGMQENQTVERFSYDRGVQIRAIQHIDRVEKILRRNADARRARQRRNTV